MKSSLLEGVSGGPPGVRLLLSNCLWTSGPFMRGGGANIPGTAFKNRAARQLAPATEKGCRSDPLNSPPLTFPARGSKGSCKKNRMTGKRFRRGKGERTVSTKGAADKSRGNKGDLWYKRLLGGEGPGGGALRVSRSFLGRKVVIVTDVEMSGMRSMEARLLINDLEKARVHEPPIEMQKKSKDREGAPELAFSAFKEEWATSSILEKERTS